MSPEAARAPVVLPPEEPNLPRIRVVVRKRPLNRKVRCTWAGHSTCHGDADQSRASRMSFADMAIVYSSSYMPVDECRAPRT